MSVQLECKICMNKIYRVNSGHSVHTSNCYFTGAMCLRKGLLFCKNEGWIWVTLCSIIYLQTIIAGNLSCLTQVSNLHEKATCLQMNRTAVILVLKRSKMAVQWLELQEQRRSRGATNIPHCVERWQTYILANIWISYLFLHLETKLPVPFAGNRVAFLFCYKQCTSYQGRFWLHGMGCSHKGRGVLAPLVYVETSLHQKPYQLQKKLFCECLGRTSWHPSP